MATKEQFDFFRFLYDEEDRRYEQLEARAKLYLSIVTLFLATLIFKSQEAHESVEILDVPWWLILTEGTLLATSLVFIALGILIRDYEGVTTPQSVVDSFGDSPPSNADFFDSRIADFVVSTTRNSEVNDKSARYLEIAAGALLLAMVVLVVTFVVALLS